MGRLERKITKTMAKSHKLVLSSVVFLAITCFQTFTILTFAAVVSCIGFMARKIKVNLVSPSFLVLISLLSLGFFGLFLSSLGGVPDEALRANFKVFIFYPIISFLFMACFNSYRISEFVFSLVYISIISIFIYSCLLIFVKYFAIRNGVTEAIFNLFYSHFSYYQNRYIISSQHIPLIGIFLPFFLLEHERLFTGKYLSKRSILVFILFTCIIILSGRRMTWLICLFSVSLFSFNFLVQRVNFGALSVFVLLPVVFSFLIIFTILFDLTSVLRLDEELLSNSVRMFQIQNFLFEFNNRPFGHGLGSSYHDMRYEERVWQFEVMNFKLLADLGILFFAMFFIACVSVIWGICHSLGKSLYNIDLACYTVFANYILQGFSNPTLFNFEGVLLIFVALKIFGEEKR